MELNRAESAAVAAVGGVPADVLDAGGRLVVSPNPLSVEGKRNVPADLLPGESLAAFLGRHVPGIECGAWTVSISGYDIPQSMWARTFPKHGQLIACRALPARSALQLVALAALTYFSGGIAAGIYGAAGGTYVAAAAGTWISAIQAGVFIAGSVLINKVLGPKIPSVQSQAQKQIYTLSDQRNTARPYEPIPVLWGEMRVTPDLASKSYAWYEGDDQYLSTILLGGINVHSVADLAIGDTPIGNYSDVSVYYNGFSGMPSQDVPLYSNVDAVAGAEFVNGGDWITRTGSAGAGVLQLDIEGQLYDVGGKGNINSNWVDLTIQARLVGAPAWTTLSSSTLTNASTDVLRRTFSFDVAPGQYEVRAKLGVPRWNDGGSGDACKFSWVSLKSVQADATDYSQWGRIGIKIRASGQLSGSLDQVRATYRAKPMPIWTGSGWATATTRADGLSNPGAILLQTLRGVWATDSQGQRVLQFGFGLSDEQIDIEGLKAFMLHCAARGYTYDKWITPSMSLGAFCEEVALAGMGEFAWTDGSRPTAVFVTNGQPNSAVVNMANMLKGGFSVDYALSNAADGIEYQWLNRDTWEMTTLRVMAPGVTTMLSPARVTGEGITSEAHAAVMARYHLAQSLYQYKTVHYTADIEHLDYRRLSVLSVSHDLTQWGFGGRVMAADTVGGKVRLTLDEPVPPLANAHVGLRIPGERDYRVWPVVALAAESDVVELVGDWPAGVAFPGAGLGNPAHDTLWCYDFKATPGYRVRVTSMEPEGDLKGAKVTCVPEGPEFWDYVLNGTYVPAPNQSSIPQLGRPTVKNLRVAEKINLQGDTEWYELSCLWDVEGDYDHAQVWAGRDGSELRLVDGNAVGNRSTFRIDGAGEWLIEVRPFNPAGRAGQMAALLYITSKTQLPPRNPSAFAVLQVDGGLRRFTWAYAGDKPPALAGVQIRYLPGDVPVSVADWDRMQPLGAADDIYTAQFETTKPDAGQWTFALRAIDTAGQLASGLVPFTKLLDAVFDDILQPDLTPPPTPTGFAATAALTAATLQTDLPSYEMGHGHATTNFYVAEVTAAKPNPAFGAARLAVASPEHVATAAVELGKTYRFWAKWKTVDGVESEQPSAPVTLTVGKVGNSDLGDLIVEAGNLADGAVSASKLAAQAVDATKFANGIEPVSVSTAGTLPTVKSTSAIVWQGKLYRWDGTKYTAAVPTTDITGQINATQLADNAVTVAKIAAGAVDAGKIAAGAVGETHLANLAVTAAKVADNAVTVSKIADGAVQAGKIAASAVTADKIAASAVDATKFASGIEPVGIVSGATLPTVKTTNAIVFGGKLYRWDGAKYTAATAATDVTGQLTDAQLAAISAAKLTGQITGTQITDGAISTPKIAAGAVSASQIAAGAVVADKLAANAVTAAAVAAGAITTAKLAANAVTANELAANAVTAGKIAAGAVSADQIAAGAITASKMVLTDSSNILPDNELLDNNSWVFDRPYGSTLQLSNPSVAAGRGITCNGTAAVPETDYIAAAFSAPFIVEAGKQYTFGGSIDYNTGATHAVQFYLQYENLAGDVTGASDRIGFTRYPNAAENNVSLTVAVPAGLTAARARFVLRVGTTDLMPGVASTGTCFAYKLFVRRSADASLIVDGAITALKIAAKAITAEQIAAGAITAAELAANSVTTAKIAANAVTATQIAAGTITAAEIASGAITTVKIAANAVTAAQIAAGTITAAELGAGSVTTAKVAAGAITAAEIAANAITAVKIAASAVTTDKIATSAVTANEIAANAITTAKIAAGAVRADQIAANSISTSKLLIGNTANLVSNPTYIDRLDWSGNPDGGAGSGFVESAAAYPGMPSGGLVQRLAQRVSGTSNMTVYARACLPVPVQAGEFYAATAWVRLSARPLYSLSSIDVRLYASPTANSGASGANLRAATISSHDIPLNTWVEVPIVGPVAIPEGSNYAVIRPTWYLGDAEANGAVLEIGAMRLHKAADASLIVDGAITATKIAAGAIAVGTAAIQDGAIVNAMIGNLAADKITAGTLAAARIAAGSIDASKLAANSVTATQLAANSVTANAIAAGTITAAEIASGAITTAKIAANAVTADRMNVSALSAITANIGTVTAGLIRNAANTTFMNLDAAGSTRTLQLGNDLYYSDSTGLVVNKLNVIGTAQIQNESVTVTRYTQATNRRTTTSGGQAVDVLTLSVPAFSSDQACAIDFGALAEGTGGSVFAAYLLVDGVEVWSGNVGALNGASGSLGYGGFSFSFNISGNGSARSISLRVGSGYVSSRYIKAVIYKR